MPLREFTEPLSILQAKQGDQLVFETQEQTPLDFQLTIRDLDGALLYGPVPPNVTRDGMLYWFVTANAVNGMSTVKTYYEVTISDDVTNAIPDERFVLYVNDHANFESYVVRALGLAGHNARRYSHTWVRGQLTGFQLKFYATAAALNAAIAGTNDNYLAHYSISIRYNENYNRIEITSVKQ